MSLSAPALLHLRGPEFLLLFAILAGGLLLTAHVVIRIWEGRRYTSKRLPTDPYEIAMLRGGPAEAIKVIVLSLIDRGLMEFDGKHVTVTALGRNALTASPVERAILRAAAPFALVHSLIAGEGGRAAIGLLGDALTARGLWPDAALRRDRLLLYGLFLALPLGLGIAKTAVAVSEGRSNILYLQLLMLLASWLAWRLSRRRRTGAGIAVIKSLRQLMSGARGRATRGALRRGSKELTMLAAVFGLAIVPTGLAPYAAGVNQLVKPRWGSGTGDGGGCGSSGCGSGGGCGGGGGGGCGGCGSS